MPHLEKLLYQQLSFVRLDDFPLFQKVVKSGPIGAISAEGAQISELAYESFMGDKNFKKEFEEDLRVREYIR